MKARAGGIIALAVASAIHVLEAALTSAPADSAVSLEDLMRYLAGTWKAAEDGTPREPLLDPQVVGRRAFAVRNVTLTIRATGDGILRVHTAIVGSTGRVYRPSLIDVTIRLVGPVKTREINRLEPQVLVVSATKRDPNVPENRWPLDGISVSLSIPSLPGCSLLMQFNTKDGREAFAVALTRQY